MIDNDEQEKRKLVIEMALDGLKQIRHTIDDFENSLRGDDENDQKFATMGILSIYEFCKNDLCSKIIKHTLSIRSKEDDKK